MPYLRAQQHFFYLEAGTSRIHFNGSLTNRFESHLVPTYKNSIEIIESTLPAGEAAIPGAAALLDAKAE